MSAQPKQPMHSGSPRATDALYPDLFRAPNPFSRIFFGQARTHRQQPLHLSVLMITTFFATWSTPLVLSPGDFGSPKVVAKRREPHNKEPRQNEPYQNRTIL